jgi:hypothetical protein
MNDIHDTKIKTEKTKKTKSTNLIYYVDKKKI